MQLPIHLEQEQVVVYEPNVQGATNALNSNAITPLIGYFQINHHYSNIQNQTTFNLLSQEEQQFARSVKNIMYEDFPSKFVWNKETKIWSKRKRACSNGFTPVGRMISIHPNQGDKFYFRLLLKQVSGSTSFSDLRKFNGIEFPTYKRVCIERGLLDDDCHWVTCLNEASLISKPRIIRVLFFNILVYCSPSEPDKLLEQFQDSMSEDFKRLHEQSTILSEEDVKKYAYNDLLTSVNKLLQKQGKTNEYYNLPMPDESLTHPEVFSTSEIDPNASSYFDRNHILMNLEQKEIFQLLKGHIEKGEGGCYNLDAPGGSGKTFLSNITLAFIRKKTVLQLRLLYQE